MGYRGSAMARRSFLRVAAALAGAFLASSSIVAFSNPSTAGASIRSRLTLLRASAALPPPTHSLALGPLSPSSDLHIDVTLKLPDPSAVTAFIASLSNRHFTISCDRGSSASFSAHHCRK